MIATLAALILAPSIALNPTELSFGPTLVQSYAHKTFTISNNGNAALVLGEMRASHRDFDVGSRSGGIPAGLSIDPGASREIEVTYRPLAIGTRHAVLTIPSNDPQSPETLLPLSGAGAVPSIEVQPASIALQLSRGESAVRTLEISNDGLVDLDWTLALSPGGRGDLNGVDILWDRSHGQQNLTTWSTLVGDVSARGASVTASTTPITAELLAGVRILWSQDSNTAWSSSELDALGDWVRAGGALLLEGDNFASLAIFNSILNELGAGGKYASASGGQGITTTIFPHFTTRQVVKIEAQLHSAKLDEIAAPATEIIRDVNESPIAIASRVGSGRVIALADELFQDQVMTSGRDNRLFGNQTIEWLAGTSWVSPDAVAGKVAPDSSDSVALTIDSSELPAGTHHLDVDVGHNIPGVAAVRVPITLTVTGHPEISASPMTLAFGSVVAGESASKGILVRNVGEEMLNVSAITISGPPFTTIAAPFSLAPLDSASIAVKFSPLEVGPASGSLFIASNDADDPAVAIALTGSGQVDCAQACAAPSVRAPTLTASDGFRFGLQILLEESEAPIDAFGFDLEFDPQIVSFADSSSTAALTSNFVVVSAEEIEPGRIRCAGFGSSAIPAGSSGPLMRVFIEVDCPTCVIDDATDLVVTNLIDDVAGMNACCGRLTIAECRHDGDVNVDGVLSSADALCAIQIYLNGGTVPPACNVPGDCEVIAADVNCDDAVTPEDAHAIYDAAAAGEAPYPCFADGEVPSDAAHAAIDPLLRGTVRGITAIEPNPTRGAVAIAYALGGVGPVHLRIVDVAGREIRSLERGVMPAGLYRALWDGREESGRESAAGIYFAVLEGGGAVSMRKVVLLR